MKKILLGLIIIFSFGCGDGTPTNPMSDISNMKLNAFVFAQSAIESQLKSPGSAKFETASSDEIVKVDTANKLFYINSYVDAQNAFGALLRKNFLVKLRYLGGDPDVSQSWEIVEANILE